MDDISEQIRSFIANELRPELDLGQLRDDEPLIESGIIDSLGMLKALAFLEEALGLDLGSEEVTMENFKTIATIKAMVLRQQTGR